MTIEQLGSVGELLAAIATMATLVYLATQIRNSTKATRTTNFMGLYDQMREFSRMCAEDPSLAELYVRACESYATLNLEDRARAHMVLTTQLLPNSVMLQLRQDEMIDPEVSLGLTKDALTKVFSMRGVREWRAEEGRWFPEDFQEHVATVVQRIDAEDLEAHPPTAGPQA